MQYEKNTKYKHKWIYAQWNGPSVTKPNPVNCKNCSSKCAYDCAQLQSSDNIPSYLQTNVIVQMLSIGGEGCARLYDPIVWYKSDINVKAGS